MGRVGPELPIRDEAGSGDDSRQSDEGMEEGRDGRWHDDSRLPHVVPGMGGERTDIPHEVYEMALAHAIGNAVEQAYTRSELLKKRGRLMQQWSDFLHGE